MELHPGQPDNAFAVSQLQEIGCGYDTTLRRRYFKTQGGLYTDDELIPFKVRNKQTYLIPYHLLTASDQDKVIEHDAAVLYANQQKAAEPQVTAIPEHPKLTSPAALAGAEAARKLKEEEAKASEDARLRKINYLALYVSLPDKMKKAAEAKQQMLEALDSFLRVGGYKGRVKNEKQCRNWKGIEAFCNAFIADGAGIPEEIARHFQKNGKRSLTPATLNNWSDSYKEQGLYGLANHYVSKKGLTSLSIVQQEFCVSLLTEKPGVSLQTIYKGFKVRFKSATAELPSRHAVGRYLQAWKSQNESLYLYLTDPDAWRSKYQFAFGDASEAVTRLNQRWEADSTKADVMCTDGRVCIVGIIDVWSRRLRLLVSPTSKSSAIGMLLRRCILDWGMLEEEFRTDNGSDYASYYLKRVLDSLDVYQHLCDPFTPEQKPHVERVFKTFSHGIVPLLDGYVGHSVAERKSIESRKSFAKRLMTKGETVEVRLSSAELQAICDRWTENWYHQEPHKSLDGFSPAAKARTWTEPVARIANERALDVLLSPAPSNDGWRIIGKKGVEVTFGGAKLWYKSAEFIGHEGERVRVLIDVTDLGHASIFREDGTFLCSAQDPQWRGISNQELATYTKRKQKESLADLRREHKQMVRRTDIGSIAEEILQDQEAQAAKITELPKASIEYTTPALEEAAVAADERLVQKAKPALTKAAKVVSLSNHRKQRNFADQYEIYEHIRQLRSQRLADVVELQWLDDYEYMLDNPNKRDNKRGLMLDDPYLLKHWQKAVQTG